MSELEKMTAVQDRSQEIGEFLDWLACVKGLDLCRYDGEKTERWWPAGITAEKLLAEYFGIDLNKAEEEKRAILAQMRGGRDG